MRPEAPLEQKTSELAPGAGHQEKELRAPPSVKLWVTGTGVGSRASLFWSQEEDDLNRAGQLSPDPSQPHD